MKWSTFTEALPPIGAELLVRTQDPLSSRRYYREGDWLHDWDGHPACYLRHAAQDLAGWVWTVLGEREEHFGQNKF